MKFGFRHADKFVGFFVLIAMVFITAAVVVTGVNKRWFAKDYEYFSRFNSASGLSVGMAVKLRGFEIGKVERITLNDKNQVDVTFTIYNTYIDKVVENSIIELSSSPLGGGLSFYPGKDSKEIIPEFSFIHSNHTSEGKRLLNSQMVDKPAGSDPLSEILGNVDPILNDVDSLLISMTNILSTLDVAMLGDPGNPLGGMLLNLEDTTAAVNTVLPVVGEIMRDINKITGSLSVLMKELENPTGIVPKVLDSSGTLNTLFNDDNVIFDQIVTILEDVHSNLSNMADMTGDLKGITPELNAILDEATGAIREGEKVLEGLSNNPILRKGISQKVEASYQHSTLRDEEF